MGAEIPSEISGTSKSVQMNFGAKPDRIPIEIGQSNRNDDSYDTLRDRFLIKTVIEL